MSVCGFPFQKITVFCEKWGKYVVATKLRSAGL